MLDITYIKKARPNYEGRDVPDKRIHLIEPVPDMQLCDIDEFFDEQAQTLFETLRNSLPGGTLDRLTGKLLAYKASHFRIRWCDE